MSGRRVRTSARVARAVDVPVLARVAAAGATSGLPARALGPETAAELVTAWAALRRDDSRPAAGDCPVVAVFGSRRKAGATTVALGLAATLARLDVPTLLVDANLDDARLSQRAGASGATLNALAAGDAAIDDAVSTSALGALDVIGAAPVAEDRAAVGRAMPALLDKLRERYRAVVVDLAPFLTSDLTRLVVGSATERVVVVRGRSRVRDLVRTVDALALARSPAAGVILNRAGRRA